MNNKRTADELDDFLFNQGVPLYLDGIATAPRRSEKPPCVLLSAVIAPF